MLRRIARFRLGRYDLKLKHCEQGKERWERNSYEPKDETDIMEFYN